jgi:hypothetical protein
MKPLNAAEHCLFHKTQFTPAHLIVNSQTTEQVNVVAQYL